MESVFCLVRNIMCTALSCWQEIDDYIAKAKEQGYHIVLHLGTKGVNYATTVLMQTAIKVSD